MENDRQAYKPGKKMKPYPRANVAGGEQLEPLLMMSGVTSAEIDETLHTITVAFHQTLATQERERLTTNLQATDKAISDLQKIYERGKGDLENMKKQTIYDRSKFNASLYTPRPSSRTYGTYQQAMSTHSQIVRQFLEGAMRIVDEETKGNIANARGMRDTLQRFIDSHYTRVKRMEQNQETGQYLRRLGMPMASSVNAYIQEVKKMRSIEKQKETSVAATALSIDAKRHDRDALTASLSRPLDLRPQAQSLDGDTPREIAALDAAFEEVFSEVLQTDVVFEQGNVMENTEHETDLAQAVTIQTTIDQFVTLLREISTDVIQHGLEHDVLIDEIEDAFRKSAIFTSLQEALSLREAAEAKAALMQKMEAMVKDLAIRKMDELRTSVALETKEMPAFLRQQKELERNSTNVDAAIVSQQSKLAEAQKEVDRIVRQIEDMKKELEAIRNNDKMSRRAAELKRTLDVMGQPLGHAINRLESEKIAMNSLQTGKDNITAQLTDVLNLMEICQDMIDDHVGSYLSYGKLVDVNPEIALQEMETSINQAFYAGQEALPHVRPLIHVLDQEISHGPLGAVLLDTQVTEVKQHKGSVLTPAGGMLRVLLRVENGGDRAGPITLRLRGVSDLSPNTPTQFTLTFHLEPGQSRDIHAVVNIPKGQERTGNIAITASTPDEEDVPRLVRVKEAREAQGEDQSMEGKERERKEKIFMQMMKTLAESPGGTLKKEDQAAKIIARYGPTADSIVKKITLKEISVDSDVEKIILAGNEKRNRIDVERDSKIAEEIMNEVKKFEQDTVKQKQLTDGIMEKMYLRSDIFLAVGEIADEYIPTENFRLYSQEIGEKWNAYDAEPLVAGSYEIASNAVRPILPSGQGSLILKPAPPVEYNSEYFEKTVRQIFLGNYTEDVTGAGISIQIALGFSGIDLPADLRDLSWDLMNWKWEKGHIGQSALDGVGILPVIGVVKNVKHADEIFLIVKTGDKEIGLIKGVSKSFDATYDFVTKELKQGKLLERHIGKTDEWLLNAAKTTNNIGEGSFTDFETATRSISLAINSNISKVNNWVKKAPENDVFQFNFKVGKKIGKGLLAGETKVSDYDSLRVILVKNGNDYKIITAYPIKEFFPAVEL